MGIMDRGTDESIYMASKRYCVTRKKIIKSYRQILQEFARETWVLRCEKTYDPALKTERYNKRSIIQKQKQQAKNILKKLKFAGGITTQQIMEMGSKQKTNFVNLNTTNWIQSTLREMNFPRTIITKKTNKRTQTEVHEDPRNTKKRTQLIIQNNGILSKNEDKYTGDVVH